MRLIDFYTLIKSDINLIGGNTFVKKLLSMCFNMQLRLILNYRLGNYLHLNRNFVYSIIIMYLKRRQISSYGCDISYFSKIGKHIRLPHPLGITIGSGCEIGDNVMIWQNVTLGSLGKKEKKYPKLKNGVKIYTNSVIVGDIVIGKNSVIGAMSFVNKSIKANTIFYGR